MPEFRDKARFEGVRALRATAGGALVCEIDGKQECIPQSQIDDDSEVYRPGDEGDLVISEWIAEKKGLI